MRIMRSGASASSAILKVVLAVLVLGACGPSTMTLPNARWTASEVIPTGPQTSQAQAGVAVIPEANPYPLSDPGPYRAGVREFSSQDAIRDGRGVGVRVCHPAVWPEGASGKRVIPKTDRDRSGARVDPAFNLSQCEGAAAMDPKLSSTTTVV